MRKLIRYTAAAFLAWVVITFAWAAFSHVTGFVGPARASAGSLEMVADAMTLVEPPGALGIPQRVAARQLRMAARSAERLHRAPERTMARLVDRLGHDAAHRTTRHVRVETRFGKVGRASERARAVAILELERHRDRAERHRDRAERERGRAQREMARARRQMERARREMERARGRDFEIRIDGRDRQRVEEELQAAEAELAREMGRLESRLEAELEGVAEELSRLSADERDELEREIEDRVREILDELRRRLEKARGELESDLESIEVDGVSLDGPVEIRIRGR